MLRTAVMIDHALLICAVSLTEHKTILQLERLAKFMKEQFMLEILQNYQSLESSKTLSVPGTRVICMCFLIILMAPFSYLSSHHSPSLIPLTTSIPLTPPHTIPHYHFSSLPSPPFTPLPLIPLLLTTPPHYQ